MPLEEILVRYDADLKEIKKEFADLKKQITGVDEAAAKGAKKTDEALNKTNSTVRGKLTDSFKSLGLVIAAAFTIRKIVDFTTQSIRLAEAGEEIRGAFAKLNDPNLLNNLRSAVGGTVNDVNLMKIAIQANNFKIPLNDLAKLFQFAKLKADETGKSVEELASTIVESIGRNSPRALVQLGISQESINAKVKETGSLYKGLTGIIGDTLEKAGADIETAADKTEKLNAQFDNLKEQIGIKLIPAVNTLLQGLNRSLDQLLGLFDATHKSSLELVEDALKIQKIYAANSALIFETESRNMADFFKDIKAANIDTQAEIEAVARVHIQFAQQQLDANSKLKNDYSISLTKAYRDIINQIKDYVKSQEGATDETEDADDGAKDLGDTYKYTTTQLEKYIEEIQKAFEPLNFLSESFTEAELAIQKAKQEMMEFVIASGELSRGETRDGARRVEQLTDQIEQVEDYGKTWQETMLNIVDQTGQAFTIIDDIQNRSTQNRIDQLDLWLEQGKITQKAYDDLRKKALTKEAQQEKRDTLFKLGLMLAEAIASLNIFKIASSLIQIGAVASQPIPKYKAGVVGIKGKGTETSDEILARLSKGESVVTAKGTKQDVGLFKAANKLKLPEYINENYVLPQLKLQMAQHKKEQSEMARAIKNLKVNLDDSDLIRTMFEQMNVQKDGVKKIVNAMKSNHSIRRNY